VNNRRAVERVKLAGVAARGALRGDHVVHRFVMVSRTFGELSAVE
jgi:hypothetical protein